MKFNIIKKIASFFSGLRDLKIEVLLLMGIKIFQVDAFADEPFTGNPAAVCVLEKEAPERWMQNVASEMNLSETAFLYSLGEGYNLRWFTPTMEVDLCGHATLASAHVLWETGYLKSSEEARFYTRSGLLSASKKGDLVELDFPLLPERKAYLPRGLKEGLGTNPIYVGKNRFDYLAEVESEEILRDLEPNLDLLKKIPTRGIIVTSLSLSEEYDFVSRFFAPGSGIDEDPVTGSAHSCLGPYWQKRLGKSRLRAYQASKRGGEGLKNRIQM
jgi:predicted PhzF superfamily epimerase YddE/YHI9